MDRSTVTPDTPPTAIEAQETPDLVTPAGIGASFQIGVLVFALLAACYVAGEIILPIVLAFVLMLVLRPVMRLFDKLRLPRTIAALVIITVLFGSVVGLGAALSGPAASWAEKLPGGVPRLQERLTLLSKPIQTLQKFLHQAEGLTQGAEAAIATVTVQGSGLNDKVLNATRAIASGLFTTVLVLFFLLVSGDLFFATARRDTAAIQRQAPSGLYLATDRSGYLSLPPDDHHHEYRGGRRNGNHRRGIWAW
jgi:predicted PurR-regulated permease PerM